MATNINGVFKIRRGTDASLASVVLLDGETGYATDTKVMKVGDGVTAWSSLSRQIGFVPAYGTMYGNAITSTAIVSTQMVLLNGGISSDMIYNSSGYLQMTTAGIYQISVTGDATGVSARHYLEIRKDGVTTTLNNSIDLNATTNRAFSIVGILNLVVGSQISLYQYLGAAGTATYNNLLFNAVRIA